MQKKNENSSCRSEGCIIKPGTEEEFRIKKK